MPPRESANLVADADEAPRDALTVLPLALPLALARRIWGAQPCDLRLRCREVARGWRDALAEPCLWTELDLTAAGGVVAHVTPALLLAAAARARGHLERLTVTYGGALKDELLAVATANASTLRLLCLQGDNFIVEDDLKSLVRAVPQQCVIEASVSFKDPRPLLLNSPPYQAVRLRALQTSENDVGLLPAAMAAHPSLRELTLIGSGRVSFASLDALVDAALTLRLHKLDFFNCAVDSTTALALPRLLQANDALLEFSLSYARQLLDAQLAPQLADALHSNHTLTSLTLENVDFWHDADAAAELFGALIGHASLTSILLSLNRTDGGAGAVAGALYGALVAANAPLRMLDLMHNMLGDANLGPLVDALPRNTHLRELRCRGNAMSAAFMRERLMPALAANASLQKLDSGFAEANAFVAVRARAAAGARS